MYIYSYNDNKKEKKSNTFLVVVLTILATVVIIQNIIILMNNERDGYAVQRLSTSQGYNSIYQGSNRNYSENDLSYVIEEVKKAVVGISFLKPDVEDILQLGTAEKWGLGSGIIVSKDGYILTNQHIAQNVGTKVSVTLHDGRSSEGRIVWNEKNIDLAIIKIEEKNLPVADLGNSSGIFVGDDVIAIGNPLGIEFQGTTTKGIISGLNRTFMFEENGEKFFMESLIQTDASINPGNSGGPLIDTNGNVIGINTVKLVEAEGIGFAIPINVVKPVIESFEKNEKFEEAVLGIYAYDSSVTPYMGSNLLLESGIYVSQIDKYGPSGKTELKVGDIIISIDGIEIDEMIELREYIYSKKPGDEVKLKTQSGVEITVALGKK